MGLKNKDGVDLREVWKDGVWTYLGLTISGFPNMFMSYTPQGRLDTVFCWSTIIDRDSSYGAF